MSAPELMADVSNVKAAAAAQCLVDKVNNAVLFPLIALMSAVAFLVFLYGCFEYVRNANNDGAREEGQRHMLYGIIGLLVMLSAYAILEIALATFGLNVDQVDCNDLGNLNNGGTMGPGFTTSPGGFAGGISSGADLPPTLSSTDTPPQTGGGSGSGPSGTLDTPDLDTPPTDQLASLKTECA